MCSINEYFTFINEYNLIDNNGKPKIFKLKNMSCCLKSLICKIGERCLQGSNVKINVCLIRSENLKYYEPNKSGGLFGGISEFIKSRANTIGKELLPTVFICALDLFTPSDNFSSPNSAKEKMQLLVHKQLFSILDIDPRYSFLDSCIWFRYVVLDEDFCYNMKSILKELNGYWERGLYDSVVSREYIEFYGRILSISYLTDQTGNPGHYKDITPFVFHSEKMMQTAYNRILQDINRKYFDILPGSTTIWSVLLVDDYAEKDLASFSKQERVRESKGKIIESKLSDIFRKLKISVSFEFEYASSVKEAAEKLGRKSYDIILLDYLLEKDSSGSRKRNKGTDLLEKIKTLSEVNDNLSGALRKGPAGRFWIFPITAFCIAFQNELQQKGISHLEREWFIAKGVDPINTPNLFLFTFVDFLRIMLEDTVYDTKDLIDFFAEQLISLKNTDTVQEWAVSALSVFLYRFGKHTLLINQTESQSPYSRFIDLYFEKNRYFKEIYEHTVHLLYLLAYDSGMEWPAMWDELSCLKQLLRESDGSFNDIVKEMLDKIKEHIVKMQKI